MEALSDYDEQLLGNFIHDQPIEIGQIKKALRRATLDAKLVPVLCGAAFKNQGVQKLLDAVVDFLPAPLDVPPVQGFDPKDESKKLTRKADDSEPFAALAFKIAADPYVGTLTFFRVYSGTVKAGSYVYNVSTGQKERFGRIVRMHANAREDVSEVFAGEIAAAIGLKNTSTGDTLCDENNPIVQEN